MFVKFKDIATFKYGTMVSDFKEVGYPVFSGYQFTGYTNSFMYNEEKVVVLCRGVGGTGKVAVAPKQSWITNLSIIVEENEKVVNYKYLYYYLSTQFKRLRKLDTGSCQSQITIESLNEFLIHLPSLEIQNKIVSILYSIDEQIGRNNAMVKRLQVLALNIFDYYSKENDGSNSIVLGDILIERKKSSIQVNDVIDLSGDIPFFTSGDAILHTKEKLISGFNIFLSTGGNAKVQAYYGDTSYSTDTWCISAKNNLEYYLYGYLKHIETQMDKLYFSGTGLKHLQKPIFLKSIINIPVSNKLDQYNLQVASIYKQISKIEQSTFLLKNLRNKVLPLLINQQLI